MAQVFTSISNKAVVSQLQAGNIGVLPTDTVYGVVAAASNQSAVARLYTLKKRENKPGTIIAAHIDQLVALGLKARYLKAVEHFWPNPISVIIPFTDSDTAYLRNGLPDIAVRVPSNAPLVKLLKQTGPLLTTSANQPGQPPANDIAEAQSYFGDKVDFYVDGGDLAGRQPSTIIRMVDDAIEVIREGAIKVTESGKVQP